MACSAYISYQLGTTPDKAGGPITTTTIRVPTRPRPRSSDTKSSSNEQVPTLSQSSSTAFVLVDPSAPKSSSGNGDDTARKNIRKHASKACAARRLATIAAKKKSRNVLTKRERQKQLAAERLEAALQQHAQKLASSATDLSVLSYIPDLAPSLAEAKKKPTIPAPPPALISPTHKLPTPDSEGNPGISRNHSTNNVHLVKDCNEQVDLSPPTTLDQKSGTFSWILEPPKPASMSTSPTLTIDQHSYFSEDNTTTQLSPRSSEIHTRRLDPFSTFPVDVKDDGKLRWFLGYLNTHIFSLMDLRLPLKLDKAMGTRHAHSHELPHFVLSSEPLFWTMALCAATILALQNRKRPGAEPITMGYRYMAIRSVNQRLNSLGQNSIYDIGLIYAIASLGVWEREKGSPAVWHSHRQGIEMLSQRLRRASQHHLVAYIIAACHTPGTVPLEFELGEGFCRMGDEANSLEPNLIAGIYECGQLDATPRGPVRSALLQSASTQLLAYRVSDAVPKAICGSKGRSIDGDRRNLEMHVLLQGAGASLIRRLIIHPDEEEELAQQNIEMIDFDETCLEAVGLAMDISADVAYDELLLWAVFTVFALNAYASGEALEVLGNLAARLNMQSWQQVESSLRLFVYLDSHASLYRDLWAKLDA